MEFNFSTSPEITVRADREKLQQILLNVVGNSVKFTDRCGGASGKINVFCSVSDDDLAKYARIHVRDTGHGIAPDKLEHVFELFVQVDQGLTRKYEGVGLGLAISRDLARGMGGDLVAESAPGIGSTFILSLPLA